MANLKFASFIFIGVLVPLLSSIGLLVLVFSFQRLAPDTPCAGEFGPVTYVHRGNLTHAQENTFDSVITGAAMNGLNPEIDVSALKDGKAVLFHDKSMKRMTGVEKDIKDLSYDVVADTPILQEIDGYVYNSKNTIPAVELIITALCNVSDGSIGINFDTKASGAVAKEITALKESNCNKTSKGVMFSTPYPGVVTKLRNELESNNLNNRIAMYMPTGEYSFLGLKFFLKTRLLQGLARGSSIMEVHKIVHDTDPDIIQSWREDGWCIGIWGITPDEVDDYEVDVYIVDEAPEFPDLKGFGSVPGTDGEPKLTVYDDNSLTSYYLVITLAALLFLCSLLMLYRTLRIKDHEVQNTEDTTGNEVDEETPFADNQRNGDLKSTAETPEEVPKTENNGLEEAKIW